MWASARKTSCQRLPDIKAHLPSVQGVKLAEQASSVIVAVRHLIDVHLGQSQQALIYSTDVLSCCHPNLCCARGTEEESLGQHVTISAE